MDYNDNCTINVLTALLPRDNPELDQMCEPKSVFLFDPNADGRWLRAVCLLKGDTPPVVFNTIGLKSIKTLRGNVVIYRLDYDATRKSIYVNEVQLKEGQATIIPKSVCFHLSNPNEDAPGLEIDDNHACNPVIEMTFDYTPSMPKVGEKYEDMRIPDSLLAPRYINTHSDLEAFLHAVGNVKDPSKCVRAPCTNTSQCEDIGARLPFRGSFPIGKRLTLQLMDDRNKMENRVIKSAMVFVELVERLGGFSKGKPGGKWSYFTLESTIDRNFGGRVFNSTSSAYLNAFILRGTPSSKQREVTGDSDVNIISAWEDVFGKNGLGIATRTYPPNDDLKISEKQRYIRDQSAVYKNMASVKNLTDLKNNNNNNNVYLNVMNDLKTSKRRKTHTLDFSVRTSDKNFNPDEYTQRSDLLVNYQMVKLNERYTFKYDPELAKHVQSTKPPHLVFARNASKIEEPMWLCVFSQQTDIDGAYYMFNCLIKWRQYPTANIAALRIKYANRK